MYYMVFLIGLLLSIVNDRRKISFKIFALILLILAFFRYGVGTDYFAYNYLFDRLALSIRAEIKFGLDNQEVLFRAIGAFLKKLGFSYQQYLILLSTINLAYIFKTCKRYSKNPTLSLLVYFCFYYFVWTFSGLRQGITLAVGIYYLLDCLEEEKTIKLILVSLVLYLIHSSALVLILLYLGSKINFSKTSLIVISFISILISIVPIFNILLKFSWLPLMNKLLPYIQTGTRASILNIFSFKSLGRLIFLFIGIFYYDLYSSRDGISKQIINIYIISLMLYFILKASELTAARISIYGMFLNVLILPNIYYLYKEKLSKLLYITCLSILCVFFFYKEIKAMEEQSGFINSRKIIMPYTSIYNQEEYIFNKTHFIYFD